MIETVDRQKPAEHLVRTGGDGADSAVMQVVEIGFERPIERRETTSQTPKSSIPSTSFLIAAFQAGARAEAQASE